ncbi:MAG: Hsp70 family protein [Janthinobacterium lividum]
MSDASRGRVAGLDFGTTNTVAAIGGAGAPRLIAFGPAGGDAEGGDPVFRSALCFWQDEAVVGGLGVEAGPAAIAEYLEYPEDSRFLQSFKSVAASASFDTASVFDRRYRFEELGRLFLDRLANHSAGALAGLDRLVVGRPVEYAGARPDPALARSRYDSMFAGFAGEVHYVYEPLAAAFGHAADATRPATLLVADFGGGTSDFSVVRIDPGAGRRCVPLGHAGIGLAGDRIDQRIVDRLVLPLLGQGGLYRSFDKVLEIPRSYFADFADWSRLALMRNRRTLAELDRLRRSAVEPQAIARMIAVIEGELGFALYDAVGRLKRALSGDEEATFAFSGGGLDIEMRVTRAEFEGWIADDLARIASTLDCALAAAGVAPEEVESVFLTGGTSLVPAVRRIFAGRFGEERLVSGGELTSIAHGLALIAGQDDLAPWLA